jgi:hypothetical protein
MYLVDCRSPRRTGALRGGGSGGLSSRELGSLIRQTYRSPRTILIVTTNKNRLVAATTNGARRREGEGDDVSERGSGEQR